MLEADLGAWWLRRLTQVNKILLWDGQNELVNKIDRRPREPRDLAHLAIIRLEAPGGL